jgi:hypothetical protein
MNVMPASPHTDIEKPLKEPNIFQLQDSTFVSSESNVAPDVEIGHASGFKLHLIVFSICLAVFVVALDQLIISTAT